MLTSGLLALLLFSAPESTGSARETLRVAVSPALDPTGGTWRLQLLEETPEGRKPVDERPAGADGKWSSASARRGALYRLRVKTEAGDGWWADEKPFEWDGGTEPREVRLGASAFRGTVVLGKKRLSARVTFTDRDGLVSVPFATMSDGTFEGVLPRDGWWNVTVSADRPHFTRTFEVKVDPVFRDGTPPDVEVHVVSRAIEGEIVDFRNQRVPLSSIHVSGGQRFSDDRIVEGGAFTWDRVVDGWMSVYVSRAGATGRETSPRTTVRVEGAWVDPGFVTLEIRATYVLRGRAVDASGAPAPGTSVVLLRSIFPGRGVAAADGRFQMTVQGGGENACLLVVDSSKAARIVTVPASESEQDVPVADAVGALSLEISPSGAARRIGALVANGCRLPLAFLRATPGAVSAGTTSGARATYRVSAGAYSLCGLEPGGFDEGSPIPPDACVSGTLTPGGTLNLRLNP